MIRILSITCLVAAFAAISLAQEEREGPKGMEQLPEAVRAAIEQHAMGATIEEIEVEKEDGRTTYEVEFEHAGAEVCMSFAACGTLLETETEVSGKTVPAAVMKGIKQHFKGKRARIGEVKWCQEMVYEVEVGGEGEDDELLFEGDGTRWVPARLAASAAMMPPAVRAAVAAHHGHGGQIEVTVKPVLMEAIYEIEIERNGREQGFAITASGDLVSSEMEIDAKHLPKGVRAALAKHFPGRPVAEAELITLYSYELEVRIGNRWLEVEVSPAGEVTEVEWSGGEDEDEDEDE